MKQQQDVRAFLNAGHTRNEAAIHFDIPVATVAKIETPRKLHRGGKPYPDEVRQAALALVRDGASFTAAAAEIGIAYHTVSAWSREAGLKSGYKRPPSEWRAKVEQARTINAARKAERDARAAERLRVGQHPPPELVQAILAMYNEGFEEIAPGFVRRRHSVGEIESAFSDRVDLDAIKRIVRGAR